jgi:3-methyladenine DNA glycosylase AlkD
MIRDLRDKADPKRAQGVQHYFKNDIVALGIGAPALREYAREQAKALPSTWGLVEAIALCDRLLQESELEIRGMGILLLSTFKKAFTPELSNPAERWLRARLDNWALVDSFCSGVLSPLLEQHPVFDAALKRWSGDPSLWVRRAALVTLVPLARRGRWLELAYELAFKHFGDDEDLMHKATGWLLREAGKTDMARLKQYLLRHGPDIPRTALRYAIERFPSTERALLLEATRSKSRTSPA